MGDKVRLALGLRELGNTVVGLSAEVAAVRRSVEEVKARLTEVKARLTEVQARLDVVAEVQGDDGARLSDILDRLDALEILHGKEPGWPHSEPDEPPFGELSSAGGW